MYTNVNDISDNNRISSLVVICDGNGRNGLFPEFGRSKNQKTGDRGAQMHKCKNAQMHKCTNVKMHKYTNAQCKNAQRKKTQMHTCTNAQIHKFATHKYTMA